MMTPSAIPRCRTSSLSVQSSLWNEGRSLQHCYSLVSQAAVASGLKPHIQKPRRPSFRPCDQRLSSITKLTHSEPQ